MRAGWEKWSNSGNEMIKVWFVASIYIHLAEKIDGKTTRCKSRNQRTLLENCPNTEFSTSSVTKFLFFFQRRGGGHIRCGRNRSIWIFYLSLSREIFWKGDDNFHASMLFYLYFHVSRFFRTDYSFISVNLRSWHYD